MLNRQTKTLLPTSEKLLQPKLNHSVPQERSMIKDRQIKYYNAKAKDLPPLTAGQAVMIEPERKGQLWRKATVIGQSDIKPRSYNVETKTGRVLNRNRKHLKLTPLSTPEHVESEQSLPTTEDDKEPADSAEEVSPRRGQNNPYQTSSGRVSMRPSYLEDYV